jgi:hypothetical protein
MAVIDIILNTQLAVGVTLQQALLRTLSASEGVSQGTIVVPANVKKVNDVVLTGDGSDNTPWGPV